MSAPRTHGARSQVALGRASGYRKQALLQRLRLRQGDLDPGTRYLLDRWAECEAERWLMDRWIAEHGWLDEAGAPPAFVNAYYAARNSAARLFTRLEPRLLKAVAAKEARGGTELERHLAARYGEKGEAKP